MTQSRYPYITPYESNPYQNLPPKEPGQLYDFLQRQAESLREQHNTTQAGDSAFPWQLCTNVDSDPQYTAGSLGRFLHPEYGILHCRYVQFALAAPTWSGAPIGLAMDGKPFGWRATNDISQSASDKIIGLGASYQTPKDAQYGWVIVSGANIQSITVNESVAVGDSVAWIGTNLLGAPTASNPAMGIVHVPSRAGDLPPGSILIGSPNYTGG